VAGSDRGRLRPTRRDVLLLGVGAFAVAAWPLTRRLSTVRRSVPVMGTMADFVVAHPDRARAQAALNAALAELQQVERWMTRFDADSDIGRVNRLAAGEAVTVSPATAEVVRAALGWAEATDGEFDPCLVRVIETWDVANRKEPPPATAFTRLAGRRLYRAVDVDRLAGQPAVRLTGGDAGLDLGGIAKGYGVDRAVEALRRHGIAHAIVNVGGDLYAMGTAGDDEPWRVAVRSPERPETTVATLEVRDQAVATSGSYLQYFENRGRRYHHLIDPATASPRACAMRSLTISADSCITADAAATALFGAAPSAARRVLAAHAPDARVELAI